VGAPRRSPILAFPRKGEGTRLQTIFILEGAHDNGHERFGAICEPVPYL